MGLIQWLKDNWNEPAFEGYQPVDYNGGYLSNYYPRYTPPTQRERKEKKKRLKMEKKAMMMDNMVHDLMLDSGIIELGPMLTGLDTMERLSKSMRTVKKE